MQVLFVAALAEESEALETSAPVLHLGVGKVQAATELAHQLATMPRLPELVVNVGTAGGLGEQRLGEVHAASGVHQHDFDHEGLAAFVGRPLPGGPIRLPGPSDARAQLATGDRVILSGRDRAALAAGGADLVDMEGYAVAATCRRFGVPVWLVKAVSDAADDDAAMTFHQTLSLCSTRLADWAEQRGLLD